MKDWIMEQKIDDFRMIIESFLEEDDNTNGEFFMWIKSLPWADKNLVSSLILERHLDECENLITNFECDAWNVIRSHQLQ